MLKERNIFFESLGKACLFSAVLCSVFVLARTFLQNDDKVCKKLRKKIEKIL
jgi:hypothetical protein